MEFSCVFPPGPFEQSTAASDTFIMPDGSWGLPAFHEDWAPLGRQAFGTPSPSEASGYATQPERELETEVETLSQQAPDNLYQQMSMHTCVSRP
ncbi:hypothetical protein EYB26_005301 [Talaromyces marneffei]|uniref:uncharacterized protein n=1 Tax=Talaromyces marneffei TaxID=37727 RepID=UPI0012A8240D|nr:uncharacterized protein EYB26_005301 [Talaromyces marneffei]QGA17626.1 hypothetical protein EYB26_005301 [Talaromyces marneffei]